MHNIYINRPRKLISLKASWPFALPLLRFRFTILCNFFTLIEISNPQLQHTLSLSHRALSPFPSLRTNACFAPLTLNPRRRGRSIIVRADDADDRGGQDEYDMVNEEVDNKKDYDVEYDRSDGGFERRRRRWGHRVRADQELHIDAGVELG